MFWKYPESHHQTFGLLLKIDQSGHTVKDRLPLKGEGPEQKNLFSKKGENVEINVAETQADSQTKRKGSSMSRPKCIFLPNLYIFFSFFKALYSLIRRQTQAHTRTQILCLMHVIYTHLYPSLLLTHSLFCLILCNSSSLPVTNRLLKHNNSLSKSDIIGAFPGLFFVYFRPFHITIQLQIEKSQDVVLGIRTHGGTIVSADGSTELWPPHNA